MIEAVELFVMDKNFQILRVVDDFVSLSWNPRFFGVGDFQLECPIKYFDDLRNATYISRFGDSETALIESMSLIKDEVGGRSVVMKGKFLKQILEDRVIYQQMNFYDKSVEDVILGLIEAHFVNERPFGKLIVRRTGKASRKITKQMTGGSVLSEIMKIEEEQKVSCCVEYAPTEDRIVCYVDVGENRSQDQQELNWVIFSEDFENIYDYEYTKIKQSKNFAYVAGAGEGLNRIVQTVDIRAAGDQLQELYVDARDLQETDEHGNAIPRELYLKNLEQRGREKLAEYAEVQEIEAKVKTDGLLQYRKDYFIGDVVDFVDHARGIDATLRIIGVNEELENGERRLELIFGKERLNLKEYIKREVSL